MLLIMCLHFIITLILKLYLWFQDLKEMPVQVQIAVIKMKALINEEDLRKSLFLAELLAGIDQVLRVNKKS